MSLAVTAWLCVNDSVYILLQFELLMGNGKGGFYSFFKTIFRGFFFGGRYWSVNLACRIKNGAIFHLFSNWEAYVIPKLCSFVQAGGLLVFSKWAFLWGAAHCAASINSPQVSLTMMTADICELWWSSFSRCHLYSLIVVYAFNRKPAASCRGLPHLFLLCLFLMQVAQLLLLYATTPSTNTNILIWLFLASSLSTLVMASSMFLCRFLTRWNECDCDTPHKGLGIYGSRGKFQDEPKMYFNLYRLTSFDLCQLWNVCFILFAQPAVPEKEATWQNSQKVFCHLVQLQLVLNSPLHQT